MIISESKQAVANQLTKHRLGPVASWLIVFVFAFSSLRGWTVLNLNLPTEFVYGFSSLLLILLALYGFNCRYRFNGRGLPCFRSLLLINTLMGIWYVLGTLLLGGVLDVSIFYIYLLPYIVFIFLRVSPSKLQLGFFLILVGISFSVIENYISTLSGGGYAYLEEYNTKLRPLVFNALSHTGDYIRVGGYTASYHDSANILGMLCTYYYIGAIVDRKIAYIALATIAFFAMTLTQSAANIVLALFTSLIFTIFIWGKKPTVKIAILLTAIFLIFALLVLMFPDVLVFTQRVSPEGDWDGMLNKLGLDILLTPSFWVGFGYSTGNEFVVTEVAFFKIILELGIIPASLFFFILSYPAYLVLKGKVDSLQLLPYLAALSFGFLSLLHYGSLLRVTNVAIFYAMYSLFLIRFISIF
jgi:hypothetical protein